MESCFVGCFGAVPCHVDCLGLSSTCVIQNYFFAIIATNQCLEPGSTNYLKPLMVDSTLVSLTISGYNLVYHYRLATLHDMVTDWCESDVWSAFW